MLDDIEDLVDDDVEEEIEEDSTEDQYSDYYLDFGEENEYVMTLNTDFDQIITDLRGVIKMFEKLVTFYSATKYN